MDRTVAVPLLVAVVGLVGTAIAALVSRRHDRDQQARQMMLAPAEEFSRAALTALAQLRYVTPPDTLTSRVHRNVGLLDDRRLRAERLDGCERAIDDVRQNRAGVTLVFHPKSWPAEQAKMIGAVLRECLELAERFYALHDRAAAEGDPERWRGQELQDIRSTYMARRRNVRAMLDGFYDMVARRMERPTWDPAKIPPADWDEVRRLESPSAVEARRDPK